jgi:hypothetical protein
MAAEAGWNMSPTAIEGMVNRCFKRMVHAQTVIGDSGLAMHWWHRMAFYIKRRSPERVREIRND